MKKSRLYYFIFFLSTIFLGIVSRKISFIPLWIGDFLYAVMIYFLVRLFLPAKKASVIFLISLLICYCIEFLQLYQGESIIKLRQTIFGRYVLGQGFLWSDILAYTAGVLFTFIIEKIILKHTTYETCFRFKQQK